MDIFLIIVFLLCILCIPFSLFIAFNDKHLFMEEKLDCIPWKERSIVVMYFVDSLLVFLLVTEIIELCLSLFTDFATPLAWLLTGTFFTSRIILIRKRYQLGFNFHDLRRLLLLVFFLELMGPGIIIMLLTLCVFHYSKPNLSQEEIHFTNIESSVLDQGKTKIQSSPKREIPNEEKRKIPTGIFFGLFIFFPILWKKIRLRAENTKIVKAIGGLTAVKDILYCIFIISLISIPIIVIILAFTIWK